MTYEVHEGAEKLFDFFKKIQKVCGIKISEIQEEKTVFNLFSTLLETVVLRKTFFIKCTLGRYKIVHETLSIANSETFYFCYIMLEPERTFYVSALKLIDKTLNIYVDFTKALTDLGISQEKIANLKFEDKYSLSGEILFS